jgi:hypothetical protein
MPQPDKEEKLRAPIPDLFPGAVPPPDSGKP